jgi:hypothetical protein
LFADSDGLRRGWLLRGIRAKIRLGQSTYLRPLSTPAQAGAAQLLRHNNYFDLRVGKISSAHTSSLCTPRTSAKPLPVL